MASKGKAGVAFEERMIKAKTGLTKKELNIPHTSVHDIPVGIYKSDDGIKEVNHNVSCKATQSNTVYCSDIFRFYNETTHDEGVEIVIGRYKQKSKTFYKTYVFKLNKEHQKTLWGDIPKDALEKFNEYVRSIPHGEEAQIANEQVWKDKRQKIYDEFSNGCVSIDAKIDKKKQRRVQCSVNINDLLKSGIPYEVYTDEYEGIPVKYEFTKD